MTPATLIRDAQIEGLALSISTNGRIKVSGPASAIARWSAQIRAHRDEVMAELDTKRHYWLIDGREVTVAPAMTIDAIRAMYPGCEVIPLADPTPVPMPRDVTELFAECVANQVLDESEREQVQRMASRDQHETRALLEKMLFPSSAT